MMLAPPPIPFPITQPTHVLPVSTTHSLKSPKDISTLKPADVLIFLAHPDDDNICAGSILALRNKNYSVQLVYATVGEAGRDVTGHLSAGPLLAEARKAELVAATQQLKINREPIVLDGQDGNTTSPQNVQKLSQEFSKIIQRIAPRLIITFGPDGIDGHPDHRQIGAIADQVTHAYNTARPIAQKAGLFHMALSEEEVNLLKEIMHDPSLDYWQTVRTASLKNGSGNRLVQQDVTPFLLEKIASLCMYRTQFSPEEVLGMLTLYRRIPKESFIEVQ